jgi:hypothetical protein
MTAGVGDVTSVLSVLEPSVRSHYVLDTPCIYLLTIHIQKGLEQGDALLPLLSNLALEQRFLTLSRHVPL